MHRPLVGLLAAGALALTACTGSSATTAARRTPSPAPSPGRSGQARGARCSRQAPEIAADPEAEPGPLAPSHPSSAVACAYAGLNEKAISRTLIGKVGVPDAESLARILNVATPIDEGAVYHCPNDDGSMETVVFAQADGGVTTVEVHRTGCRFAISTTSNRAYRLSPAAHRELDHLMTAIRPVSVVPASPKG